MDITVIIVSYNSADDLPACLRSLKRQKGVSKEIIVVDNASSDNSKTVVKKIGGIKLIANRSNTGFASANNTGAQKAKGRYILFLNPDTIVPAGALKKLLLKMDNHPDWGICGSSR